MKLNSGILGGTFDPVHIGHIRIAESFLRSRVIDKLLVLPAPAPPHKKGQDRTSFEDRLKMLRIAFQDHENVEVSDLELQLPEPSYTIRTIKHLQKTYPDVNWYLCLGEDSLVDFHKWYKSKEILKRVPLLVAERPGFDSQSIHQEILNRTIFVEHDPVDVSSTGIRETVQINGIVNEVPARVGEYIMEKGLYK